MQIVVFGAGGVGGYFGGRLVEAGHDVTFVARGEHLQALQQSGIKIKSPKGDFSGAVKATEDPATLPPPDLVLMATKAWQIEEAARSLSTVITDSTTVVPLQNGVEAADDIAKVLGSARVVGGLCRILSHVVGPGQIEHAGADPTIVIGELSREATDRCQKIGTLLNDAPGMETEVAPDIHVALWRKFLLMAPISGLSSVTRAPMGVLRSITETRELLATAMTEVVKLAQARGVAVSDDAVDATLSFIDTLPDKSIPSMHRDIADGRPSELESQTGAVVRLGRINGVSVPVNDVMYRALLPLELQARGKITFPA